MLVRCASDCLKLVSFTILNETTPCSRKCKSHIIRHTFLSQGFHSFIVTRTSTIIVFTITNNLLNLS